jgi:hypothetical protein
MEKRASKKRKWSNFHITVMWNLNIMETGEQGAFVRSLVPVMEHIFHKNNAHNWLHYFNKGERRPFSEDEVDRLVETVRGRIAVENQGEHNRSVHIHVLLEIGHTTSLQINYAAMKKQVEGFTYRKCRLTGRFVPGEGEDKSFILQYITKEIPKGGSGPNADLARVMGNGEDFE